jgi:hypothetical protein
MPPVSPIPPVQQNHEGNLDKTAGDISSTGDIISPANKIPPVENHQNHAQKPATGDTESLKSRQFASPEFSMKRTIIDNLYRLLKSVINSTFVPVYESILGSSGAASDFNVRIYFCSNPTQRFRFHICVSVILQKVVQI